MLNNFEVLNILDALLYAKTNSVVACTAVDIEPIVSSLLARNPDLMYVQNSRILRNRKNNARVRFVTTLNGAFSLVGLRFENSFILQGLDPELCDLVKCRSLNNTPFELFGG